MTGKENNLRDNNHCKWTKRTETNWFQRTIFSVSYLTDRVIKLF